MQRKRISTGSSFEELAGYCRAIVDGVVLANSARALVLREHFGDRSLPARTYFPREDVDLSLLTGIDRRTRCPIKGTCEYFDYRPDGGKALESVAWSYDQPLDTAGAQAIKDYVAFDDSLVAIEAT